MTNATDAIRAAFDERAPSYDDSALHRGLASVVADFAEVDDGATVVDIATGTGLVLRALSTRARDLTLVGVDISSGMLAVARAALPQARWIQADVARLPLETASADVITCVTALHLVPDPDAVIAEWARVLRPGGRVITATFLQADPHHGRISPPTAERPYPRDHASFSSLDALSAAVAPAGFVPVRSTTWSHEDDDLLVVESAVPA